MLYSYLYSSVFTQWQHRKSWETVTPLRESLVGLVFQREIVQVAQSLLFPSAGGAGWTAPSPCTGTDPLRALASMLLVFSCTSVLVSVILGPTRMHSYLWRLFPFYGQNPEMHFSSHHSSCKFLFCGEKVLSLKVKKAHLWSPILLMCVSQHVSHLYPEKFGLVFILSL